MSTLRELFRYLAEWRAVYESYGVDTIRAPDGTEWVIWDVEYLFDQVYDLPPRQQQVIILCLLQGKKERVAAIEMGLSPKNPVMTYATEGLKKIVGLVQEGRLERFKDGVV